MTLHEQLRDLVEHLPEGVTTVTLDADWLRRQVEGENRATAPPSDEDGARGTHRLLTTSEAAARLSVESETIARWCRDGRFPNAFKFSASNNAGEWRIPEEDVQRFNGQGSTRENRVHFTRS